MARISERDAIRLGLLPPPTPTAVRKPKERVPGMPVRQAHNGGRIARGAAQGTFDVLVEIPFDPKTKHRPRTSLSKAEIEKAFMRAGGSLPVFRSLLSGIKHRTVTPNDTRAFEELVRVLAAAAMRGKGEPHAGPVHLDILFSIAGDPQTWPTAVTDPDLDNMEKAVCDALNGIVWKDDRLVVGKSSAKVCATSPSIRMRIRDIGNASLPAVSGGFGSPSDRP